MDAETKEMHAKRGRWYEIGDHEICITETTIRGFRVLVRPVIDNPPEKTLELKRRNTAT